MIIGDQGFGVGFPSKVHGIAVGEISFCVANGFESHFQRGTKAASLEVDMPVRNIKHGRKKFTEILEAAMFFRTSDGTWHPVLALEVGYTEESMDPLSGRRNIAK